MMTAPLIEEDERLQEDGDREHIICPCGTKVTICGAYWPLSPLGGTATEENSCTDCWRVYEPGWTCSRCGREYGP